MTASLQLRKIAPMPLRSLGLDERWLQDRISDDPTILGLGELEIVSREHRQPVGGRIDFLMRGDDGETYYEVEVMLGALDESHIIRTIEYWDLERQRRPQFDHRAVIVAEQITSRFFNVLRLLNRSVPMVAIQLGAFRLNQDEVVLHPITVLNIIEEVIDAADVDPSERADRTYWEKKASPEFLSVVDKLAATLRANGIEPRLTYNRHHIAIGSIGYNFSWCYPRKLAGNCHIESRLKNEEREVALANLQAAGIDASPHRSDMITYGLSLKTLDSHIPILADVLKKCEEWSRR